MLPGLWPAASPPNPLGTTEICEEYSLKTVATLLLSQHLQRAVTAPRASGISRPLPCLSCVSLTAHRHSPGTGTCHCPQDSYPCCFLDLRSLISTFMCFSSSFSLGLNITFSRSLPVLFLIRWSCCFHIMALILFSPSWMKWIMRAVGFTIMSSLITFGYDLCPQRASFLPLYVLTVCTDTE